MAARIKSRIIIITILLFIIFFCIKIDVFSRNLTWSKMNSKYSTTSKEQQKRINEMYKQRYQIWFNNDIQEISKYNIPEYKLIDLKDGTQDLVLIDKEAEDANNYKQRENAVIVMFIVNENKKDILDTVRIFEDRFNSKFHYDWVFISKSKLSYETKVKISSLINNGNNTKYSIKFGEIPKEHWDIPEFIDEKYIGRKHYESIDIRRKSRYLSGFFHNHELLLNYEYYLRVEPKANIVCDLNYDIFKFMNYYDKKFGFITSIQDDPTTLSSLWSTVKSFLMETNADNENENENDSPNFENNDPLSSKYISSNNMLSFISNDHGDTYNLCNFWPSFEVADFSFFRGEIYQNYFNYLDKSQGFFKDKWSNGPIFTISTSLFLKRSQIHYFSDLGYHERVLKTCPNDQNIWIKNNCLCNREEQYLFDDRNCIDFYYQVNNYKHSSSYDNLKEYIY